MLETAFDEGLYTLTLARPEKRNAINGALIAALDAAVAEIPAAARVILVQGQGPHFCAGLDLAEHRERDALATFAISRQWQGVFGRLQEKGLPIVAALSGAVIGGGLELAACAHIRVADRTAFYQLPEGQHGIFLGGGGSVRLSRLLGADRLGEMILTGRRVEAEEGRRLGLSHYLTEPGEALALARVLAKKVGENAPLANWALVTALPRIADLDAGNGFYLESLAAAFTQTGPEARQRMNDFLQRRVRP